MFVNIRRLTDKVTMVTEVKVILMITRRLSPSVDFKDKRSSSAYPAVHLLRDSGLFVITRKRSSQMTGTLACYHPKALVADNPSIGL